MRKLESRLNKEKVIGRNASKKQSESFNVSQDLKMIEIKKKMN